MQKKCLALTVAALLVSVSFNANAEGKNGIAAVVNGEKITVAELKQGYESNKQIKEQVSFKDFYEKALDIFVNGKMLYQAAEGEKITQSPEYKKQLAIAQEEIARKIYIEKKVNAKVNDTAVKKLYDDYKKNFQAEKEMKAKHILVDSETTAKEVIAKLKKGGNFDTLAKEYSKEPAELGYFTKGMMVPEFGNAAFTLKKGEYSQTPVKTQFGYHVIMVEDMRDAKPLPLKTIEPQLKGLLTQQAIAEVLQTLTKNAKIEKYDFNGNVIPNTPAQ
ncbi:MAG: peptidylprolyl isomerase [Lactobacillus sp.]|jgi:peptidyl-prolyl cis-trans isomerase C|nr:peptidylprolyl isomerase [Lactobacillus sp.]